MVNDKNQTRQLRKRILEIAFNGQDANLQSVFSSIEILYALKDICFLDVNNDFVLSKGQSSLGLIAVLEGLGIFDRDEVNSFCKFGSRFSMQLDYTKFNAQEGIRNSAGSLGHGFPMAVGKAYARKIKNQEGKIFCLAGDGEMNEGTMWEACAFAAGHKLDNIVLIVDDNHSIGRMIDFGEFNFKLESFGFNVLFSNGHDVNELQRTYRKALISEKPCAIIAKTVRGYGSNTLMNDNSWFHRAPNKNELELLIKEVDEF